MSQTHQTATILSLLQTPTISFPSCQTCLSRIPDSATHTICQKCKSILQTPVHRYRLTVLASFDSHVRKVTIFGPTLNPLLGLPPISLLSLLPTNPSTTLVSPQSHRLVLNTLSHILQGAPLSLSISSKHLITTQPSPPKPPRISSFLEDKENVSVNELVEMLKEVEVADIDVDVKFKLEPIVTGEIGRVFKEGFVSVVDLLKEELGLWDGGSDIDGEEDDNNSEFDYESESWGTLESFDKDHLSFDWNYQPAFPAHVDPMVDLPDLEAITLEQFLNIQDHSQKPQPMRNFTTPRDTPTTPSTDSENEDWGDDSFLTKDMQEIVDILEAMALEDSL
ncbi:hypothetical protein HK097_002695 [Rhizophlyctis rosea]|uniref:Uncharacterized protein n=1 Tax=Rhizophlyctis rosea TaxID=64517 RepID=A0AAD5X0H5_9FUNG|nr:hypothetical protein HK097_002695 [Rhizophlyctis rosea]